MRSLGGGRASTELPASLEDRGAWHARPLLEVVTRDVCATELAAWPGAEPLGPGTVHATAAASTEPRAPLGGMGAWHASLVGDMLLGASPAEPWRRLAAAQPAAALIASAARESGLAPVWVAARSPATLCSCAGIVPVARRAVVINILPLILEVMVSAWLEEALQVPEGQRARRLRRGTPPAPGSLRQLHLRQGGARGFASP